MAVGNRNSQPAVLFYRQFGYRHWLYVRGIDAAQGEGRGGWRSSSRRCLALLMLVPVVGNTVNGARTDHRHRHPAINHEAGVCGNTGVDRTSVRTPVCRSQAGFALLTGFIAFC
jgi:hypothetical protein